jgi:hypothetical protein
MSLENFIIENGEKISKNFFKEDIINKLGNKKTNEEEIAKIYNDYDKYIDNELSTLSVDNMPKDTKQDIIDNAPALIELEEMNIKTNTDNFIKNVDISNDYHALGIFKRNILISEYKIKVIYG